MIHLNQLHIRRLNAPNPVAACAVCLYHCGLGYNRISGVIFGTNHRRRKIAVWIQRRRSRLNRSVVIPWKITAVKPPKKQKKQLPERKLKIYLRSKIWQWFKHGLHPKSSAKLTGCSRADFVVHIQSQFHSGMTLANYGKFWHLDHRKPCSRYDLHDPWQRHLCFHWTNYQPMLAKDNRVKAAKFL